LEAVGCSVGGVTATFLRLAGEALQPSSRSCRGRREPVSNRTAAGNVRAPNGRAVGKAAARRTHRADGVAGREPPARWVGRPNKRGEDAGVTPGRLNSIRAAGGAIDTPFSRSDRRGYISSLG